MPLSEEQVRHLHTLRMKSGDALELLFSSGVWRADLAELGRHRAMVCLVSPLHENREAPFPIHGLLPITAQLNLWDEWLPPLVELGITLIQPVVFSRSEFDGCKVSSRRNRWERIIQSAVEQSHRSRIPELRDPIPFRDLLAWKAPQKWLAYEVQVSDANPILRRDAMAFTSGPEGGLTKEEFESLREAGWEAVALGKSILRAVTAPIALLGAIRFQWHL